MLNTTTPNYALVKPTSEEFYDVSVPNGNMDKIDAALKALSDALGGIDLSTLSQAIQNVDKKVTEHSGDDNKHKTANDIQRIANALQKIGDTMTGDLVIEKGIPRLILKPTLSPADPSKRLDVFYNANASNNFGIAFNKDGKTFMLINSESDVQFWHPTDGYFSIQNLKSSVSSGKKEVADATTQMGVVTSPTAEFATIAANIRKIYKGRQEAKGTGITPSDTFLTVTGLAFTPKIVLYWIYSTTEYSNFAGMYIASAEHPGGFTINFGKTKTDIVPNNISIQSNGFTARTMLSGGNFGWMAFG